MNYGTKTIRSLNDFYGSPVRPTQDERLAAASRILAERTAAAQDRIDLREHDRRYHGGQYESGEPCPFREKIAKMEENLGTLDPKDADGDGNSDFPDEEEEAEEKVGVEVETKDALIDPDAATDYLSDVSNSTEH